MLYDKMTEIADKIGCLLFWSTICIIISSMNMFMENLGLGLTPWASSYKVTTTEENDYLLKILVPGVKKEDLTITIEEGDLLSVKGESEWIEVNRDFRLPLDADLENMKATLENGVLELTIPKTKKQKLKIEIL